MTKTKEQIIYEQTQDLIGLISRNLPTSEFEIEIAKLGKLKHASLQNAIAHIKDIEIDDKTKEIISDIAIAADVGNIKTRPFQRFAPKVVGLSEGEKVKKSIKTGEIQNEKHSNVWIKKRGAIANLEDEESSSFTLDDLSKDYFLDNYAPKFSIKSEEWLENDLDTSDTESEKSDTEDVSIKSGFTSNESTFGIAKSSYYDGIGEDVCEYIATNISHVFLDSEKKSPKVRLIKDKNGDVSIGSKFLKSFTDLAYSTEKNQQHGYVTGFGECFAASFLLGDIDMNMENIGIIKENSRNFFARIDFGKALSYNAHMNDEGLLEYNDQIASLAEFQEEIQDTYQDYFHGVDFAGEVFVTIDKLETKRIEKTLKLIMRNLKEAYRDDFLTNPEIEGVLKRRMGFRAGEVLSEEKIKNKMISNMTILAVELNEMAEREMQKIFPLNPELAIASYRESYIDGQINYGVFAAKLKEKGINLNDIEQFKPEHAKLPKAIITQMKAMHSVESVEIDSGVLPRPRKIKLNPQRFL